MKKIRCSSLPQLVACGPSVMNPQGLQEVYTQNEPASLGTLVHEFCQRIVTTGEFSTEELQARHPEDMERAELLIRNFFTLWREAKLTLTNPQCEVEGEAALSSDLTLTGHIDVCQYGPEVAHILDYKTGRVHDNHYHQVAGYAYLLWAKAGYPTAYTVNVAVAYLEDLSITSYTITVPDLMKLRQEVIEKSKDPRYTVGRRCAFCPIQGACPGYREYTRAAIEFFQTEDALKGKVGWVDVEPAERGSLVDAMYVVEQGTKRVKESLKSVLSSKKGETSLDLGDGVVYSKTERTEQVLLTQKALPLLRQRFKQELLDDLTTLKLSDVLDLVASFAAKGSKQKAREEFVQKLYRAGAVIDVKKERHERRNAAEGK